MKKIPCQYELDEDDIKSAIALWLEDRGEDPDSVITYSSITFKVAEEVQPPPGGHRGGGSDPVIRKVVSAIVVKDD